MSRPNIWSCAKSILFLLGSILFISCDDRKTDEKNEKVYYDLRGFIENQIVYLKEKKPQVTKVAKLDGEQQTVQSKEIDWEKELGLFLQADINKPVYAQSYQVVQRDSGVSEYKLKPNADLPVQYLKIINDSVTNAPTHVLAIIRTENRIYKSEKEIELTCLKVNNLPQIASYTVRGYQKLIFMEPKSFNISSKIGQ